MILNDPKVTKIGENQTTDVIFLFINDKKETIFAPDMKQKSEITRLNIETHPLAPFIPEGASVLMLGSFPPKRGKWSMEFYYPNWQNDMWRIFGLAFFNDKDFFVEQGEKRFRENAIREFLSEKKIAVSDTAQEVIRLQGNASDKYLNIVTPVNLSRLLQQMPMCRAIITTGQKACETAAGILNVTIPKVGTSVSCHVDKRRITLYRMPSSSRAYPLALDKKAAAYRQMFIELNLR